MVRLGVFCITNRRVKVLFSVAFEQTDGLLQGPNGRIQPSIIMDEVPDCVRQVLNLVQQGCRFFENASYIVRNGTDNGFGSNETLQKLIIGRLETFHPELDVSPGACFMSSAR